VAAWVSNQAYLAGDVVSHNGNKWTANQWNYDEAAARESAGAWNNDSPC